MTIQELAKEAGSYFFGAKRSSGETYRKLKDERPEWVYELVREAHGDMLPDDWRYAAIETVLEAIENERDADEVPAFEADVYTSDLMKWLGSSTSRPCYVDEAVEEFGGEPGKILDQIMLGQVREYEEIWGSVIESLKERLSAMEDEEAEAEA